MAAKMKRINPDCKGETEPERCTAVRLIQRWDTPKFTRIAAALAAQLAPQYLASIVKTVPAAKLFPPSS